MFLVYIYEATCSNSTNDLDKYRLDLWKQLTQNIPFLSNTKLENSNNIQDGDIKYYLYTKKFPKFHLLSAKDSFHLLSAKEKVKVAVHGWTEHYDVPWIKNLTSAYLRNKNYNVIVPDWSSKGDADYFSASSSVKGVGDLIGDFLIRMNKALGMDYKNVHLISHSLGCHVAGLIGQRVIEKTKRKLGRITALDPAAPIFDFFTMDKDTRLSGDDALFVDIVHTDGGMLGFKYPIGTVDFFPNGGTATQPSCSLLKTDIKYEDLFCSHQISHRFFLYSINSNNLIALPCSSYDKFSKDKCNGKSRTIFGEHTSTNISGNYYVNTKNIKYLNY